MPRCADVSCNKVVPAGMLMCKAHWFRLPKPLRDAVWATYRARPFDRDAYMVNVRAAVDYTARFRPDDSPKLL